MTEKISYGNEKPRSLIFILSRVIIIDLVLLILGVLRYSTDLRIDPLIALTVSAVIFIIIYMLDSIGVSFTLDIDSDTLTWRGGIPHQQIIVNLSEIEKVQYNKTFQGRYGYAYSLLIECRDTKKNLILDFDSEEECLKFQSALQKKVDSEKFFKPSSALIFDKTKIS